MHIPDNYDAFKKYEVLQYLKHKQEQREKYEEENEDRDREIRREVYGQLQGRRNNLLCL